MHTMPPQRTRLLRLLFCCALLSTIAFSPATANDETLAGAGGAGKTLRLCCPEEQWYPFLYAEDGAGKGMLVDIVKKACEDAGFTAEIEVYPLNRCLRMMEYGKADGIIGLPYDKKYATAVEYPPGSPGATESSWRILQIDEVVITNKGSDYEYAGNARSLPEPVRFVHGAAIASDLKQAGLTVEELATNRQLFSKLIRDKNGSVVTNTVMAELYEKDEAFHGLVDINAVPLRSSSYYLVFSWQSRLTKDGRDTLWREIRRCRQNYAFMLRVFSQY